MKTFFTTMLIFLVILLLLGLVFYDYVADWFVDNTNHARAENIFDQGISTGFGCGIDLNITACIPINV